MRGTIAKWFPGPGYGFALSDAGEQVFVHVSALGALGLPELERGTVIEFEVEHTARGPRARDVEIIAAADAARADL